MKLHTMLLALVILISLAAHPAQAQSGERCFPETGYCISGRIREFWEQNGALPVFGFPKGPQQEMQIEGRPIQAQVFERNRLELHPENARPYDVLLGRLGVDRLSQQGRDWFGFPKSGNQPGCRYFPETDQSVCGEILNTWRANGLEIDGISGHTEGESLALFGLPISGLMTEELSGQSYQVQWFERARFELHPENQPPYHVLLGLLGNELSGSAPPQQPAPLPQPAPVSSWSGQGSKVIDITLGDPSRITLSHDGERNFIVRAFGANDYRELMVNEIGPYQGSRWLPRGAYTIELQADGNWRVDAVALGDNNDHRAISGRGDFVSDRFVRPGRTVYTLQHDGQSNFIVLLYCADGSNDLVANEIGAYAAEVVIEFPNSACIWDVQADGNWRIAER